jgi:hypothetical protein
MAVAYNRVGLVGPYRSGYSPPRQRPTPHHGLRHYDGIRNVEVAPLDGQPDHGTCPIAPIKHKLLQQKSRTSGVMYHQKLEEPDSFRRVILEQFGRILSAWFYSGQRLDPLTRQAWANWRSRSSRAPAPMEQALPRREQNFVREQPDADDDEHDADNLVHCI